MGPHDSSTDPFTQFWSEAMSRMGLAGQPAPPAANDAARQMQRLFLDALAKYCDDFMRSPQFLEAMKRQMDSALAFQQQVNHFLIQAQRGANPAGQADAADLASLVRQLQAQVESLQREVSSLRGGKPAAYVKRESPRKAAGAAKRPSARRKRK